MPFEHEHPNPPPTGVTSSATTPGGFPDAFAAAAAAAADSMASDGPPAFMPVSEQPASGENYPKVYLKRKKKKRNHLLTRNKGGSAAVNKKHPSCAKMARTIPTTLTALTALTTPTNSRALLPSEIASIIRSLPEGSPERAIFSSGPKVNVMYDAGGGPGKYFLLPHSQPQPLTELGNGLMSFLFPFHFSNRF